MKNSTSSRYEVIFDYLMPPGMKRWYIWDTHECALTDEPRYDHETAKAVCDDLNEFGLKESA